MEDYKAKQKFRKKLYSKVSLLVLGIVTIFLIRGAWNVQKKEIESRRNLAKVEQALDAAKEREATLLESIEYLNSQEGIEEEIREKFSVAKDGEEVVLIVDRQDKQASDEQIKGSLWGRVVAWLKNLF
jgi:cell division protein FtsB